MKILLILRGWIVIDNILKCPECDSENVVLLKDFTDRIVAADDEYICLDCLFDFKVQV
ncbi:MAG: hypothetical protein HPY74_17320 [Firmicutes bacterium]|nr:hypothetical protein [Bacillota bacterium]